MDKGELTKEDIDKNKVSVRKVAEGFIFMIIACAVYLVWWFVNYYPDSPYSDFIDKPVGLAIWIGMFAAVFVLCIAGIILIGRGIRHMARDRSIIKIGRVPMICLAASILLPLLISRIRFITLDIFLIIWWAYLELGTAEVLYGSHLMEKKSAGRSLVRTRIYTGISLFLYIIYPFPPVYVRFALGAVPIILYAADMTWMAVEMKKAEALR